MERELRAQSGWNDHPKGNLRGVCVGGGAVRGNAKPHHLY